MLVNNEIKNLIIAMGTNIGEQFRIEDLRYDRIILMTDADVDGAHIRTLLLTLFYRYFPTLITEKHLYIAQPPLFRIGGAKDFKYAFSEEERDLFVAEYQKKKADKAEAGKAAKNGKKSEMASAVEGEENAEVSNAADVPIQRYKGFGEMNPEQLWETTMDPASRVMKLVTVDDAKKADTTFDILMGSEVEPRKRFLQTHAKSVKNLDI
ncbi:MAG: toprim domain-containing protein, partial [Patescibacteria group bacterium]